MHLHSVFKKIYCLIHSQIEARMHFLHSCRFKCNPIFSILWIFRILGLNYFHCLFKFIPNLSLTFDLIIADYKTNSHFVLTYTLIISHSLLTELVYWTVWWSSASKDAQSPASVSIIFHKDNCVSVLRGLLLWEFENIFWSAINSLLFNRQLIQLHRHKRKKEIFKGKFPRNMSWIHFSCFS